MKTVLFACIHNAGRSQMAAAWFNALADPGKARAVSAGTEPGTRVHPEVLDVMREVGIDLSEQRPRFLTGELARAASLLITMGCGEACPFVPGLRRADWPLEDPKGKPAGRVREIRDEVRVRVSALLAEEGWASFELSSMADADVAAVLALLDVNQLPTHGVGDSAARFFVARSNGVIIGSAGLEIHGASGLLRSVAVASERRGQGIAAALVEHVVAHAARGRLDALYLLTTSARDYFARLGFTDAARNAAPEALQNSWEFRSGCPASAALMRRSLSAKNG